MRFGVVILVGPARGLGPDVARIATQIEEAGLDVALLQSDASGNADALTAAAFLADSTEGVRIVATVPVGVHPLHIAEQAAVADNALQGRLLVALDNERADPDMLSETATVLLRATGPRPFEHRGAHWSIPGHVEGNVSERRIAVTPKPAQLELPIWVSGAAAAESAAELGLSYLARSTDGEDAADAAWTAIERTLGRAVLRLRRPAIVPMNCESDGSFDDAALVHLLTDASERWGLDVAILELPPTLDGDARRRAIARLGSFVRPHLQMDAIPERVRAYWQSSLPGRLDG